jgi:DEAD/DEAH box helicase domain-containing protein
LHMAELVLKLPMNEGRWLSDTENVASKFAALCRTSELDVQAEAAGSLYAAVLSEKDALVLSHPLWHTREGLATSRQVDAKSELRSRYGSSLSVKFCDIRQLVIRPQKYLLQLSQLSD